MKFVYSITSIVILIVSAFILSNFLKTNASVEAGAETSGEAEADFEIQDNIISDNIFIPVLMYHHFVQDGEKTSYTTVSKSVFEEQITYLKLKGYNTVTDQEIADYYYNGRKLPENPIHITIDDGYLSNYEIAYPILKENEMKATIYVIASRLDKEYSLPRLTWEQAKEMSDSGVISIQSHTYDLHHKEIVDNEEVSAMIAFDDSEYQKKILDDLKLSKMLIEYEVGKEVVSISYPFGHYDENTLLAVKEAGYKVAYTVEHGVNNLHTNPLELYRINVSPGWTGETIVKEIEKQKSLSQSK